MGVVLLAERRMIAKTIIDSDAFIEMPMASRLLYYDLSLRADDDGFVNAPKKITRMIGATIEDLDTLIKHKFILSFPDGVIVIKHWRINNYIRKDAYTPTKYSEHLNELEFDENGSYRLCNKSVTDTSQECNKSVTGMSTQDRKGKDRKGKDRKETNLTDLTAKIVGYDSLIENEKVVVNYMLEIGEDPKAIQEWVNKKVNK